MPSTRAHNNNNNNNNNKTIPANTIALDLAFVSHHQPTTNGQLLTVVNTQRFAKLYG
jgi:hypothetical protein